MHTKTNRKHLLPLHSLQLPSKSQLHWAKSWKKRSLPPKGDKTHGEAEAQQTFPPRQGAQKKHGALQLGWLRMDVSSLHSWLGSLWRFIIASRLWNSASVAILDVGWMRLVKIVIVPQKGVHWQHHRLEATAPSNAHVALEVAMHLKLVNGTWRLTWCGQNTYAISDMAVFYEYYICMMHKHICMTTIWYVKPNLKSASMLTRLVKLTVVIPNYKSPENIGRKKH